MNEVIVIVILSRFDTLHKDIKVIKLTREVVVIEWYALKRAHF